MENRRYTDVGGTPGGIGHFLLGCVMIVFGAYLLASHVMVASFFGGSFGLTLLPFITGIGVLFFNGRSVLGWLLLGAGALFVLGSVILNLHIFFRPASLFDMVIMMGLLTGGVGLVARSLFPYHRSE